MQYDLGNLRKPDDFSDLFKIDKNDIEESRVATMSYPFVVNHVTDDEIKMAVLKVVTVKMNATAIVRRELISNRFSSTDEKSVALDDMLKNMDNVIKGLEERNIECDRYGISDRTATAFASAVLQDIGIVHEGEASHWQISIKLVDSVKSFKMQLQSLLS
ncbi:hypothetical protein AVEN_103718-1 [Araneus ventricosus]|uniref:Uncharacterized protein n=1 Tax=Araneus ventricosus TaxID=182803 RepID=A0A4Y2X579_ARAVE|nr:hypothetical protein AVEN_103718-1 [Araneus ventricosus]